VCVKHLDDREWIRRTTKLYQFTKNLQTLLAIKIYYQNLVIVAGVIRKNGDSVEFTLDLLA
jgi:hypothetical protein